MKMGLLAFLPICSSQIFELDDLSFTPFNKGARKFPLDGAVDCAGGPDDESCPLSQALLPTWVLFTPATQAARRQPAPMWSAGHHPQPQAAGPRPH